MPLKELSILPGNNLQLRDQLQLIANPAGFRNAGTVDFRRTAFINR
jgi:hypothetical protein